MQRLPSCVTPSLDYYQRRSHAAPKLHAPEGEWSIRFWVVSTADSSGTRTHGYGNINPLSIDYACRPRLRSRLTLGGLAWPRNPWSYGGQGSHFPFLYSFLHFPSPPPPPPAARAGGVGGGGSPPPPPTFGVVAASAVCLSPATLSAHNHLTSE